MRIGILGTGTVGQTLGTKLVQEGHDVRLGARAATSEKAEKWAQSAGEHASHGTFADAASFGAALFNCTAGSAALAAVGAAGAENMAVGRAMVSGAAAGGHPVAAPGGATPSQERFRRFVVSAPGPIAVRP
jgi:8-hydroxy-5-deazaflavin:NADPH oxidoreductase